MTSIQVYIHNKKAIQMLRALLHLKFLVWILNLSPYS
jgi:hypothetical protein